MKKVVTYCTMIISVLLISNTGYSQVDEIQGEDLESLIIEYTEFGQPKPGTYEIYHTNKEKIIFSKQVLAQIELNRHATEEKIIYLGYNTTVRILPLSVIEREDFIPLTEK